MIQSDASQPDPPSSEPLPPRRKITDSPWYWMHLFCVASLVGLMLVGPKFARRQAGVERKFQGRQRADLKRAGEPPETPLSTPDSRHVQLLPLYLTLGGGAALSWLALWLTRIRPRSRGGRPTKAKTVQREDSPP